MAVVQLQAAQANRQQRRARMGKSHALKKPRMEDVPLKAHDGNRPAATGLLAEEAVLLDLFGRQPVAFHRSFVDIAGGVSGALWLSHAVALTQEPGAVGRAFHLSAQACAEATGMSRREQEYARRSLRSAGLLTESRVGESVAYRLDFERLAQLLLEHSAATWALRAGCQQARGMGALHMSAA